MGYETALQDAHAMGRPFEAHVSHLLIHGFLHLLGYDHIESEDAKVMEPLEAKFLRPRLARPLRDRAHMPAAIMLTKRGRLNHA
jgi:probable rRNA maturation factor